MLNAWNLYNLAFAMANIAYEHYNSLESSMWKASQRTKESVPQSYWDVVDMKRKASDTCGEVMDLYLKG